MSKRSILVVEDDPDLLESIAETLELSDYHVTTAQSAEDALEYLRVSIFDMILTDIQMSGMDGLTLQRKIHEQFSETPVIVMTAYGTIESAVSAMHSGVRDYLTKPFTQEALLTTLSQHLLPRVGDDVIASDPKTRQLLDLAKRMAPSEASILITGESGTGKEVIAKYIHSHSGRSKSKFLAINCAAIPENMLEATLFGYEKGAFTGATSAHPGKFEQAQGGTLLLDEITEMDLNLQAKLLRVLQEKEVERLGGKHAIKLDVRVLATSNRDMKLAVEAGEFREDLYYRLNVLPITLPPLRDRPADVQSLAEFFIRKYGANEAQTRLSPEVIAKLNGYHWPGNVRELDNVIQRAVLLADRRILTTQHIIFAGGQSDTLETPAVDTATNLQNNMKHQEFELILAALNRHEGCRQSVADELGISGRTLRYKLAKMKEAGVSIPKSYGKANGGR